jgi:predicted alpha/beta hydrolase family esterase
VSLSRVEFEEWWGHPVTRAYMATLRENVVATQEEALAVAHHRSIDEVALNAVAYANRANTLLDVSDISLVASMMEVPDEG